jgi:hypothetical protein
MFIMHRTGAAQQCGIFIDKRAVHNIAVYLAGAGQANMYA